MNESAITKDFEINNGFLKALFSNGDFRKLEFNDVEFIQRIYYAVRDEEWLNVPYTINNFKLQTTQDVVICSYTLSFGTDIYFVADIKFVMKYNHITIEANGKALTAFKKNRIGFCLHLPANLKGVNCLVTHTDHTTTASLFPLFISPHQPFKNIAAIEWIKNDQTIKVILEGDIFEMEDQRNWTDASYKIYATPLELPFPVEVKAGDKIYQKISIMLSGEKSFVQDDINQNEKEFSIDTMPCPLLGIMEAGEISVEDKDLSENISLPFSHYRVDFRLQEDRWKDLSLPGIKRAEALSLPVYAVVYFNRHFKLQAEEFITYIHSLKNISLHSICLLSSENFVLPDEALQTISNVMRRSFPGIDIGAGTDANFAQLNRNRPKPASLDFICYSIQPQEHASDTLSIIENIQGQADTIQTIKTFSGDMRIHIAALSFFKRFNANINYISNNEIAKYECEGSNFEAAWFIASLHQLIVAGADSVNCVYPVKKDLPLINFFNYMAVNTPEYFYTCGSLLPEKYAALSWMSGNKRHAVFANLLNNAIEVFHPYSNMVLKPFEIRYTCSVILPDEK